MPIINHGAVQGLDAYMAKMDEIAKEFADNGDKPNEAVTLMSKEIMRAVWTHMHECDTEMQAVSPELIGRAVSGALMSWVTAVMPARLIRRYAQDIAKNMVESMKIICKEAEADAYAAEKNQTREGVTLQ